MLSAIPPGHFCCKICRSDVFLLVQNLTRAQSERKKQDPSYNFV